MIVHYWLLSIAVLLLWLPRQWLRFGVKVFATRSRTTVNTKNLRDANDVSLKFMDEIQNPRNWVDVIRALAGSIAVCLVCFEYAPGAPKHTAEFIFIIQCVILLIALFIQTARNFQQRITLVAPIFFIFGLSVGVIGWKAALFSFVTIWVINLLIPTAATFLMVFALLELIFARFLSRGLGVGMLVLAVFLTIGPVLLSAMMKRRLVKLTKKPRVRTARESGDAAS